MDVAGGGGADGVEVDVVEWVCWGVEEAWVLRGGGYALRGGEGVAGWDDGEDYGGGVGEGQVCWVEG